MPANQTLNGLIAPQAPRDRFTTLLLENALNTGPVQHWTQGASRLAHALLGGLELRDEEQRSRDAPLSVLNVLQGQQGAGAPAPQTSPPPSAPPASMPPRAPSGPNGPPILGPEGEAMGIYPPTGGSGVPMPPPRPMGNLPQQQPMPMMAASPNGGGPAPMFGSPSQGQASPPLLPPNQTGPMPGVPVSPQAGGQQPQFTIPRTGQTTGSQPTGAVIQPGPGSQPGTELSLDQIRTMLNSNNENVRRFGATALAARTSPEEYSFHVAGDNLYRMGKRSGRAELVADAQRAPEAVRVAQDMVTNARQYGYGGPEDARLQRDIGHRLSGLTTPGQNVRDTADTQLLQDVQQHYTSALRMQPALISARAAIERAPEGYLGNAAPIWGRVAASIGLPVPEGATAAQMLQSIAVQYAPLFRQPGATSNMEMQLYMQAGPRLGDTRDANLQKLEMMERLQQRAGDIMDVVRRHAGSPDLQRRLAELDTPIFTDQQRVALRRASGIMEQPGGQPTAVPGSPGYTATRRYNPATGRIE